MYINSVTNNGYKHTETISMQKASDRYKETYRSVPNLVFSTEDAELVGYFAITIKPITVNAKPFSNTVKRKLSRVRTLNKQD